MAMILLLRRDESTLTSDERRALEEAFQGKTLEFKRADPADYHEHAENCKRLQPDAVLLPLERPIPSQAMDEGFRHIAIRGTEAVELMPLKAEFKPFKA
jgi:hypothetical protein